ncbi:MAG: hypothetical protein LBU22_11010 [Dysgonamonadaceae bacterium]|jgi:hypothetical protein|nr:hypothetical protein [Dysgonamonadaceae bacterium]
MTETHAYTEDPDIDTAVFVVIENEDTICDFVTIDEDASFDAIVIDISQEGLTDAITVGFETDADDFVTIDEEDYQIFVSDFKENDFL